MTLKDEEYFLNADQGVVFSYLCGKGERGFARRAFQGYSPGASVIVKRRLPMCGVVGLIGDQQASSEVYSALLTLQHRGQDAAGILSYDFQTHRFHLAKSRGLVSEVFQTQKLDSLQGSMAIGHARYQTVGSSEVENIQPLLMNFPYGLALAHNGNTVNYQKLLDELRLERRRLTLTSNDLEVILHLLADHLSKQEEKFSARALAQAVGSVMGRIEGGHAVVGMVANEGLFAFRDPKGIRPLVWGVKRTSKGPIYAVASESNALSFLGFYEIQEVRPGELIYFPKGRECLKFPLFQDETDVAPCMFEWVYFSNPESELGGQSIYQARKRLGEALAKKVKKFIEKKRLNPTVVVPVPDTSRVSAQALAQELGLPCLELLIKNRYIQRSFILENQSERRTAVQLKLAAVRDQFKGQRVLLVDDSIVRGTTSSRIVKMVRSCEAEEVTLAVTCPPIVDPCVYGIDFPSREELIASGRDLDEVNQKIGADETIYLDQEDLLPAIGVKRACTACLTGDYPTPESNVKFFCQQRQQQREDSESLRGDSL